MLRMWVALAPIVGGSDVAPGEWPDTVAVLGTKGTCSGTLIAPDVVLTAGHCAGIEPHHVVADSIDYAQPGGARVEVASTVAYPDWARTYDVAIVTLASPITTVAPRPIGTACTFAEVAPSTPVQLVGFGATDVQGTVATTRLKQATTYITDPTCAGGSGCNAVVAPGGEFVAGGTGTADSCFGDSGGPVYLDTAGGTVLVGAVSRGVAGAATPCGGGGIYVRVDKVVPWLEDMTGSSLASPGCASVGDESDTGDTETRRSTMGEHMDTNSVGCTAVGGGGLGLALATMPLWRRRRTSCKGRTKPSGDRTIRPSLGSRGR